MILGHALPPPGCASRSRSVIVTSSKHRQSPLADASNGDDFGRRRDKDFFAVTMAKGRRQRCWWTRRILPTLNTSACPTA